RHGTSHSIKKAAMAVGTEVLFTAEAKLGRFFNRREGEKEAICTHKSSFVPCHVGVVYSAPFSCGNSYVGQTGKCVNKRLMQHKLNASSPRGKQGHVPDHILNCGCKEEFRKSEI